MAEEFQGGSVRFQHAKDPCTDVFLREALDCWRLVSAFGHWRLADGSLTHLLPLNPHNIRLDESCLEDVTLVELRRSLRLPNAKQTGHAVADSDGGAEL